MRKRTLNYMESILTKFKKSLPELKKKFNLSNDLAVPRIEKVVVSTGIGSIKDPKKRELVPDRLAKITGQKPVPTLVKKAVAGFKTRQGEVIGYLVTLRGARMYAFLDRLINVAIPRTRDFRGIDPKAVDEMGNLTIGVREHTVFPETADEELKDIFGFSVTIVTTAKDREEALEFLTQLGVPFRKAK